MEISAAYKAIHRMERKALEIGLQQGAGELALDALFGFIDHDLASNHTLSRDAQ